MEPWFVSHVKSFAAQSVGLMDWLYLWLWSFMLPSVSNSDLMEVVELYIWHQSICNWVLPIKWGFTIGLHNSGFIVQKKCHFTLGSQKGFCGADLLSHPEQDSVKEVKYLGYYFLLHLCSDHFYILSRFNYLASCRFGGIGVFLCNLMLTCLHSPLVEHL